MITEALKKFVPDYADMLINVGKLNINLTEGDMNVCQVYSDLGSVVLATNENCEWELIVSTLPAPVDVETALRLVAKIGMPASKKGVDLTGNYDPMNAHPKGRWTK